MPKERLTWRTRPAAKDFDAALSFLSLLCPAARAQKAIAAFRRAKTVSHPARDLLRASGLPLLPRDEPDVAADLKRIHKGKALSPVLLIRGDLSRDVRLMIADGYHRICAVCYYDEKARIACLLVPAE